MNCSGEPVAAAPGARSGYVSAVGSATVMPAVGDVSAAEMSIAVLVRIVRICAGVSEESADLISAAMAAACGAAADVPENGVSKLPTPVTDTPSAAVMSGLSSTCPPVDDTSPGVIAVPSAR